MPGDSADSVGVPMRDGNATRATSSRKDWTCLRSAAGKSSTCRVPPPRGRPARAARGPRRSRRAAPLRFHVPLRPLMTTTPGSPQPLDDEPTLAEKVRTVVVGKPKDIADKRIFHSVSLVAFLAWVGLGADGLSSSSYGPEEAYKTLGEHIYL